MQSLGQFRGFMETATREDRLFGLFFLMLLAKIHILMFLLTLGHISRLMGKELPSQNSGDMYYKRAYH